MILLFVEDPGAVNCMAPLVEELEARGVAHQVLSAGLATALLESRGVRSECVIDRDSALGALSKSGAHRVVVGTSENPASHGLALLDAARDAGVESVAIVDFAANAAFRFRGLTERPLAHPPDWLFVPDRWTADEFGRLGFPAGRIVVVGHPQYDETLRALGGLEREGRRAARARVLPAAGAETFVLTFISEISDGLDAGQFRRSREYTLDGRGASELRTEIVIEEMLDALAAVCGEGRPRPYLVLRRHPKETDADLRNHVYEFDHVSRGGSPLDLVYASDLVVGMSSMLLMEGALMEIPTLSILPRLCERDWLPTIREGVTPCVTDRPALHAWLRQHCRRDAHTRPARRDDRLARPTGGVARTMADRIAGPAS